LKLRKLEEQIKSDWFQKMKQDGEDDYVIAESMGKTSYKSHKQFTADLDAKYKREKENEAARQTEAAKEEVFNELQRMENQRRESGTHENVVP